MPGSRRQHRQGDGDSAAREGDGACHSATRRGDTGLSWKWRGKSRSSDLAQGLTPHQGHRWSSLSLPSIEPHQKSLCGVSPRSLPCTQEGALGEGPGRGGHTGLCDTGTWWRWHQKCQSPDEVQPGASPSASRRSPQHPALRSQTCQGTLGTPGTPRQRGAGGSKAPTSPAPLPSLRSLRHQLRPFATPAQRSGIATLPSLASRRVAAPVNPGTSPR